MRLAALACLCLLAACAGPGTVAYPQQGVRAAPPRDWRNAEDELSLRMRKLAAELEPRGLRPTPPELRDFVAPGDRRTRRLTVAPRACLTLVTIATRAVHDIDAALYTPEGDLLTADTQPDAHPTIQVCAGDVTRNLYYAVHVYEGAGSLLMVPFVSDRPSLERAASILASRPAVADLSGGATGGVQLIASFADGLRRRGFEASEAPVQLSLSAEQQVRVGFQVAAGYCYTAAGFVMSGETSLQLRVVDDEGQEVARDSGKAETAVAQFCARHPGQYAAELQGGEEGGTVVVAFYRASDAEVGGQSGLWLGDRPLAKPSTLPLSEALSRTEASARTDGYRLATPAREGRVERGEATSVPVELRGKTCTRIHAVGGRGVRELELRVADAEGATLAEARGDALGTYAHVCTEKPQHAVVEVHARAGYGRFAVQLFAANLSVFPKGASPAVSAEFRQAARQARAAGYRPHRSFTAGPLRLDTDLDAQRAALQWGLVPGLCLRAYLLSADLGLSGRLLGDGKTVDFTRPAAGPARVCRSPGSGVEHVRLELSRPPQRDAWLMLYERGEPSDAPGAKAAASTPPR